MNAPLVIKEFKCPAKATFILVKYRAVVLKVRVLLKKKFFLGYGAEKYHRLLSKLL